jgi:predicted nucleic acid-binding protein
VEKVSLILDTSFIIALNDAGDFNYKNASSLKIRIKDKEFGQCYISDYIFDELITLMRAKAINPNKIKDIGDSLLADETIELLKVDTEIFLQSWGLFKKSSNLSFTDCTTTVLAKEFGIKNVASFDSGFDKIPYIKRI